MARGARGGVQRPRNPAPVSGPGALSQRTDGGAGNPKQPIRETSGGEYGSRKAAADLQGAAPMAAQPRRPLPEGGVFGPTERPNETAMRPVQAPALPGSQPQPMADPDTLLRAAYRKFPSPWIARLISGG